ncbi:MAG: GLPGLI family protein [Cyclobacteriaceae bacterium]
MERRKHIITLIIGLSLALFLIANQAKAQQFEGIATYLSDQDMSNFSFSGKDMAPGMADQLKAQLKKQFQKEYELKFNLTESAWQEAEGLDAGMVNASAGGMSLSISVGNSITYKNSETKKIIEQTESFSKQFLIVDELEDRKWVLTGKTKKIGEYLSQEATYQHIREIKTLSMFNEDQTTESRMDTTMITAWFSPQIPVPHGPDDHWGLPGLILEITDGKMTYLCTKVVLNPKKKLDIKAPTKGKKVSKEEFEIINNELAEEMMKKYSGGSGEHSMSIKIGN